MAKKQLLHTGAQLDAAIRKVTNNYADVSPTTATPSDVLEGKIFIGANKQQKTGTRKETFLGADVFFKVNSSNYEFISVPIGKYISAPVDPDVAGYYFQGWFTEPTGGSKVTFPVQPQAGTTLYAHLIAYSSGLSYSSVTGGYAVVGIGNCQDNTIVVPKLYNNSPVVKIGNGAFSSQPSVFGVILSENITEIGQTAFIYCSNLTSVTIPDSVTQIGTMAFDGCTALTDFVVPKGVTALSDSILQGCSALRSVTLHDGITSIGDNAFLNDTALVTVTIPANVSNIGVSAFYGCSAMTSIIIHSINPPTLGQFAFDDTNNCPIYVPNGYANAYRSAWPSYASRIYSLS